VTAPIVHLPFKRAEECECGVTAASLRNYDDYSVELTFAVETSESDEKIEKLIQLTERYCVVLQTLQQSVAVSSRRS
jgi:uncharacterized OsmC-like protein